MSKYYKAEDVIRKYAEMIADEAYWEHGVGDGKPDEEDLDIAREYYSDLPTIEVSEYADKDEAFMKGLAKGSVEGYFAGRASVEVSEDCISREWVHNILTKYVKDYELNELDSWQNTIVEWIATDIEDAPSVVPTTEPQAELVRVKYHCINCAENGSYKCSKCDGEMYYKYDKDEPQTCSFSDCDNFKNPDYARCIECKRKQIKLQTDCAWNEQRGVE